MSNRGFIKGIATGLVLGAAATMLVDPISDRQRHRLMRKTEGMFRNIGDMMDSVLGIFS